jgi:hypothetical protein
VHIIFIRILATYAIKLIVLNSLHLSAVSFLGIGIIMLSLKSLNTIRSIIKFNNNIIIK